MQSADVAFDGQLGCHGMYPFFFENFLVQANNSQGIVL